MKKLFVCAMALAAFVSCSKDDVAQGPALDSQNKSISITILNGSGATRADGGITTPGVGAVVDGQQTNQMASASASQLDVLFANSSGKILKVLPLAATGTSDNDHTGIEDHDVPAGMYVADKTNGSSNTYIWHNVPWDVTQIAVVRYYKGAAATETTAEIPADITINEGTTLLADVAALATDPELNLTRELQDIVLYGVDTALEDLNQTHEVDGISYHYWKAEVTVTPQLARFEVNNIECEDLGYLNTDGNNITYGFDELKVKNLTWVTDGTVEEPAANATEYTAFKNGKDILGILYGRYSTTPKVEGVTNTFPADGNVASRQAGNEDDIQAGAGKVWSWNVPAGTTFDSMTVDLEAVAYDYTLTAEGKNVPLYITGLNESTEKFTFNAANIYQMNLVFVEGNVKDKDQLCVQVQVVINPWTINTVRPVFGQNGSSSVPDNAQ